MTRKNWLLLGLPLLTLTMLGCPVATPTTPTTAPPGDPSTETPASLTINADANRLQQGGQDFPSSTRLLAQLANATGTFAWLIEVTEGAATPNISFRSTGGLTATGAAVTVDVDTAPADDPIRNRVTLTGTLEDGSTLTTTVLIEVVRDADATGQSSFLTVTPTADPAVGTSAGGDVTLSAQVSGALAPEVQWAYVGPTDGGGDEPDGVTLPADLTAEEITVTFADGVTGVFLFQAEVLDNDTGNFARGLVRVFLGVVDLTLDLAVTDLQLNPNSEVNLRTIRAGGATDLDPAADDTFSYQFQILDENGTDVLNNGVDITLDSSGDSVPAAGLTTDATQNDWTISGLEAGVFRVVLTVVDRDEGTNTRSLTINLAGDLALAVAPTASRVGAGNAISLETVRSGGVEDFTYDITVLDATGAEVNAGVDFGTPLPSNATDQDFTDADGLATPGQYLFIVDVTDGSGNAVSAATQVVVGDELSLDAKTDNLFVNPSDNTTMTFDVNGGVGPYTYTFANFTTATGTPGFSQASPAAGEPGDLALTWTAPAFAAGVSGTYRTDVTVTDSLGNVAVDSVIIEVGSGSGAGFTCDLQTTKLQIGNDLAHTDLIRVNQIGGTGPFTYEWDFLNLGGGDLEGGAVTFTPPGDDQSFPNAWDVTLDNTVASGTYRVNLTLTDTGTGNECTDSLEVLVGDILTANLTARSEIIGPGVPVDLLCTPNGRNVTYSFVFSAVDAEGDAAGTLSADPADGLTGGVTWVAPSSGSGTYYISCLVTDVLLGTSVTASISIEVTRDLGDDLIIDPPAAQTSLGNGGVNGLFENGPADGGLDLVGDLGEGATDVIDFVPETPDPGLDFARSLTMRFIDNNTANLTLNSVTFTGTNQRGDVISTTYVPGPAGGTDTIDVPFRTVDRVEIDYANWEAGDTLEIGIGEWFGLSAPFASRGELSADRSFHVVATDADLGGTPEGASFLDPEDDGVFETAFDPADQQAIRFPANAPDGTQDYIVQYEPMRELTADIDVDVFILSAATNDTAGIAVDVSGGVPPYDYTLSNLGTLQDDQLGTVTFPDGDTFANVNGDLPDGGQLTLEAGGGPAAGELHWIRVEVSDSAPGVGNSATATVPVLVVP